MTVTISISQLEKIAGYTLRNSTDKIKITNRFHTGANPANDISSVSYQYYQEITKLSYILFSSGSLAIRGTCSLCGIKQPFAPTDDLKTISELRDRDSTRQASPNNTICTQTLSKDSTVTNGNLITDWFLYPVGYCKKEAEIKQVIKDVVNNEPSHNIWIDEPESHPVYLESLYKTNKFYTPKRYY